MLIHVKVHADSKEDVVIQKTDTSYDVHVREPAEQNRANSRMLDLMSRQFIVPRTRIKIVTGHHSPSKILEIIGKI